MTSTKIMKILLPVLCLAVLVLGVHSADKSSTSSVAVETLPTDNVAAASSPAAAATATSSASVAANAKNTKRSNADEDHITAAETQHQYDDRHISPHHPRAPQPQQLISQNEYLAYIRDAERSAAAAHENASPDPYGKLSASPERVAAYYPHNPSHPHPLAGSSLEKEIEKLVSSNAQQFAHPPPPPPQQAVPHQHHHQVQPQHHSQGQPHLRTPVVYKNHNDIVYIPYQHQQIQTREPYGRPGSGITKAKVQLISAYPRTPFPNEALEYVGGQQQSPPQYTQIKPQESFKELYIQQQRENHLKRLQNQQHHQQLTNDNLNQQSHAQPLSISLLPKKQAPPAPQIVAEPAQVSPQIAQLAERLFKTPLEQQKPLTQDEFKALVAAGYPVQAVPVPVAVTKAQLAAQQYPQRYAPSTVSVSHPQPFTHPTKQVNPIVQIQYQQQQQPQQPHHQAQHHHQTSPHAQHRFYTQGQFTQAQPNTHTTYQQLPQGHSVAQAGQGPYTYVVQPGENEESAAEQLRQQIIQEINAQQQKGSASAPTRLEYQQHQHHTATSSGNAQHQHQASKPLTEEQKEYYKRLEYYSHQQQ